MAELVVAMVATKAKREEEEADSSKANGEAGVGTDTIADAAQEGPAPAANHHTHTTQTKASKGSQRSARDDDAAAQQLAVERHIRLEKSRYGAPHAQVLPPPLPPPLAQPVHTTHSRSNQYL